MSDGIKMNVARGQGLIHTLKKFFKDRDGADYEIKGKDYVNVMEEFIKINNNRKANGQKPIYFGGENYKGGSGHENFIVHPGDIEFSEDEVKNLYAAMGLEFTTHSEEETNPQSAQQTATSTTGTETQGTGNEQKETQKPATVTIDAGNNPQGAQQPEASTGTKAQGTQQPEAGTGTQVQGDKKPSEKTPAAKPQAKNSSVTFDSDKYYNRINKAKISADVVKAETDAYIAGAQLKEAVTKVDLKGLNQYADDKTWNSSVDEYFSDDKNSVLNASVKGAEYDSDKRSIKDRVVQGEKEDSPTLQQDIKDKGAAEIIKEETEVDLKNVNGLDLTKIQNLKTDATSEQIKETAQQLSDASKEIKEAQNKVDEKMAEVKQNIDEQNSRIDTQIRTVKGHKNVIKQYLAIDEKNPSLKEYNDNKEEIEKTPHNNYEAYGKYQFAREARDKQILSEYADNIKVVDGKWDFSSITDNAKRKEAEAAYERLGKKYPDMNTQLGNIESACKEIKDARQKVVDGLKDIAKYQFVDGYLKDVEKDLNAKSQQLNEIYEDLEEVDKFIEDADARATEMAQKEQKKADKAKAAADKKAGVTSNKSNESRTALAAEDKKDPSKATRKAEKKVEKSVKAAEKTVGKTKKYQQRQEVVNQYNRAVFDLNEAKKLYSTGKQEAEKVTNGEVTSKEEVPEELKQQFSILVSKYKTREVSFVIKDGDITVKDKVTGKEIQRVYKTTTDSEIRQYPIPAEVSQKEN